MESSESRQGEEDELESFIAGLPSADLSEQHLEKTNQDEPWQRPTRRKRVPWIPIILLAIVCLHFSLRSIATLLSYQIFARSSVAMSMGLAGVSGMAAFLIYTKHTEEP